MKFYNILDQLKLFAGHSLNMDTMKIKLPNGTLVSARVFNRIHQEHGVPANNVLERNQKYSG